MCSRNVLNLELAMCDRKLKELKGQDQRSMWEDRREEVEIR